MSADPVKEGKKLEWSDRRRHAIEMREQGASYEQIGRQLGISRVAARKHVMAVLKQIRERTQESGEEVLQMELRRLDRLMLKHWETRDDPQSAGIILKIMDRRARFLGLDAPEKKDVTYSESSSRLLAAEIVAEFELTGAENGQSLEAATSANAGALPEATDSAIAAPIEACAKAD